MHVRKIPIDFVPKGAFEPSIRLFQDMVQQGLHRARKAVSTGKFDIVIMDEVCVAIFFELLKTQDLLSLLEEKPESDEGPFLIEERLEEAAARIEGPQQA